jgi:hypothetical protein
VRECVCACTPSHRRPLPSLSNPPLSPSYPHPSLPLSPHPSSSLVCNRRQSGEELRVCTMYFQKNAHNQHQGVHGAAQEQCRQAPLAYQLLPPPPPPSYTTSCYHTRELCFTARGFSARGEIPLNCSALTSHAGHAFNRPRPPHPPPPDHCSTHARGCILSQLPASMPVDMAIENLSSGTERISAGVLHGGTMARTA